jgi:hypothetical protein
VASDGSLTAQTTFSVVVSPTQPTNNPPIIAAISGQTLNVNETRNLPISVSDPDGDALTVTTGSSNNGIVEASVISNSEIRIRGVSASSASVTVTVTDTRGGRTSTVFSVTVNAPPPANNPPTIATIPNQTVDVGRSVTIDLTLSDLDNDPLTFSPASANAAIATTGQVDSNTMSVTGVAAGSTQITVSVGDGRGGSAQTTFTVTVNAPQSNNPPTVDSIQDVTCEINEQRLSRFSASDPDGDPLTFTLSSSATNIATANDNGDGTLTVSCLSGGTATITVTADDARGGTANTTFRVTVNTPADQDNDGVPDTSDGCPTDANKNDPGVCGCGNPDTGDTDNDGTLDCVDTTPRGNDDDNDGIPALDDACPSEGDQGNGVDASGCPNPPPSDSDGDGVADGADACPADPNKTTDVGQCGCGVAETDTDSDGTADCVDTTPRGHDNDGDGIPAMDDACPDQGDQGNGVDASGCPNPPPSDSDGDGVADGADTCPTDPNKTTSAGQCGCGVAETDTDSDGTADCVDTTPRGHDNDGDGIPAMDDACPDQGDQGNGVDASGCPISAPPPSFDPNDYDEVPTFTQDRAREILTQCKNTNLFSVVGDETATNSAFLDPIASGVNNYGSYPNLQDTVNHYTGSFTLETKAASDGWTLDEVINTPSPDAACGGATPLACELQTNQPSVIVVMFAAANVTGDTDTFRANLNSLVTTALDAGTIPVLSTIPDDTMASYNAVIVEVATNANVPLWNRYLTEFGKTGGSGGAGSTDFTATSFVDNSRNLAVLQVLEQIRTSLP